MEDLFYGSANLPIVNGFLGNDLDMDDYFSSLPEEVQQEINQHEGEFHSAEELHQFAENLIKRS